MSATDLLPIVVLVTVLGIDAWVFTDAQRKQSSGTPVVATLGPLELTSPTAWLLVCLVLFVVFFPLYVVARGQAG
ncbi:MAG TPA: hypothetical protein VFJ85_19460 [Acidimicrobiales bacterium]|nr:hypothetical protein [Acidimicrobiales bacterium]